MPTLTQTIVNNGFKFPDDIGLEFLLPDLLTDLGSPDPQKRSDALAIFNAWIENGTFSDDWLKGELLEQSLAGMRHKLGSSGDDSVFVRSYFALLLLELLHHNLSASIFNRAELETIHAAVTETFLGEQDYRTVIPGKGWAYAVPHVCDNFWKLVQAEGLEPHHHKATLETIGAKLRNTGTHVFKFLEDERLAYVTVATLRQGRIAADFFEDWVMRLTTLQDVEMTYLAIVELPAEQHAAYCNVRTFLRSLYFQLSFRDRFQNVDLFSTVVETGIKRLDPGFYTTF